MKLKIVSLSLLMASAVPLHSNYYTYHHKADLDDLGKLAIGVAGAAVAGYGLYKVGEWLFGRSDEQVIDDVNRAILGAFRLCDKDMQTVTHYNTAYETPELVLYELACSYYYKNESAQSKLTRVGQAARNLDSEIKTMSKRLYDLDTKKMYDAHAQRLYISLYDVKEKASQLVRQLWKLHDILSYHMPYFSLYEYEAQLLKRYEQEVRIVDSYTYDSYVFDKMLRAEILSGSYTSYPYRTYGNRINDDTIWLQELISKAYSYTNRHSAAKDLYTKLDFIKRHILSDPIYLQEVRDYEREQLEKQRLAAQQAHIWALQQQANALRTRNEQLQRINQIQEDQLRWERASCYDCCTYSDCIWCDDNSWYCSDCVSQYNYTPTVWF